MEIGTAKTIATPMSDADIKEYLPHANIIKYSELSKYPTLHDLLPDIHSFAIILYEDSPNKGHWIVVSRPSEGIAEYFDSYGGYVDAPLKWTPPEQRAMLGEGKPMLSMLFNQCEEDVVYNKIHYQKEGEGINDCGRWVTLRTLKMKAGMDLKEFYEYILKEAKERKASFDVVVAEIIE